ncbi:19322_t:CDS:2, partial [Cetraspora pellucida]
MSPTVGLMSAVNNITSLAVAQGTNLLNGDTGGFTGLPSGFLSALVMNTLGRGSGTAVEALSWIYLGLSIVWLGTEL